MKPLVELSSYNRSVYMYYNVKLLAVLIRKLGKSTFSLKFNGEKSLS
jgi:hypothetical protein